MIGICTRCGAEQRVPSARTSGLAAQRCRRCGGELRGRSRGRRGGLVRCVVCGRRRQAAAKRVRFPDYRFTIRPDGYEGLWLAVWRDGDMRAMTGERLPKLYEEGPHPAGSPVCADHAIVPAGGAKAA